MLWKSPFSRVFGPGLPIIICAWLLSACSLTTPVQHTPTPTSDQKTNKDFFRTIVDGKSVPRDFQCAWAPVSQTGWASDWYLNHGVVSTTHCNVQFDIDSSKSHIYGKLVDPTMDQSEWKTILKIAVAKHYTYRKKKDKQGRDTNDWEENTTVGPLVSPTKHCT